MNHLTDPSKTLAASLNMNATELQSIIVNTVMPQHSKPEEVAAFMVVCNTYNLNPLLKEIAAFPTDKGIMPIVMIDGWIKLMNQHSKFNGMRQIDNFEGSHEKWSVTTEIFVKGIDKPISVTEYYSECYNATQGKPNQPWDRWPRRMLRHKSLIQCIRYAFGISGIYDRDEIERMEESIDTDIVNNYICGPQPTIPSYQEIENAVKQMGLELRIEKQGGSSIAYVVGNSFNYKNELKKIGFRTKKGDGKNWHTYLDVTQNLKNADAVIEDTLADLEEYLKSQGFSIQKNTTTGGKTFMRVEVDENNHKQIEFVTGLGFIKTKKGYIKNVTSIKSA